MQLELRPVEVRSDSAYVVNGIARHSGKWRDERWQRKRLMLSHADLWAQMADIFQSRQAGSIKVVKVKGHATWEDVLKGSVAPADKHGNDQADNLAVAGALEHKQPREELEAFHVTLDVQRLVADISVARQQALREHTPARSGHRGAGSTSGSERSSSDSASSGGSSRTSSSDSDAAEPPD